FVLSLAKRKLQISLNEFNEIEKIMLLMLRYDIWQKACGFDSLELSILEIGRNKVLLDEFIEVLEILIDNINFKEIDITLPYDQPLTVHSRYTRDQILTAFGLNTFERKSPSREGVAENTSLNTELLFI